MVRFLLQGLLRDRSRSLFPVLIVTVGVAVTVLFQAFMNGAMSAIIETNAKFDTGHLKVMTRFYAERSALRPNDLALTDLGRWLKVLQEAAPIVRWQPRIKFAALLDIPDARGETLHQAPVAGVAIDLMTQGSTESANLGLAEGLVRGQLPQRRGEILVSEKLFEALALRLGQKATLISSGMDGSMAVANFSIVGTVRFGIAAMDRGAVIADLKDMQKALFMDDAASEIIGLFRHSGFQAAKAEQIKGQFNTAHSGGGKFAPVMITLREQGDLGEYLDTAKSLVLILTSIFVCIITLVFWNAGIRAGIRRYAEFGLRLAIGEEKRHLFGVIILESLFVGIIGSVIGTALGLIPAWYFMHYGLDMGAIFNNAAASLLTPNIIRADITRTTLWIGFLPGIFATVLGTAMAASAIFRRQTAQLFKELEI